MQITPTIDDLWQVPGCTAVIPPISVSYGCTLQEAKHASPPRLHRLPSKRAHLMASIYRCLGCGTDLNLSDAYRYPPGTYFEAGDKGTVSFSWVDESKFKFTKESKIRPFFETVDYWGIERTRTKMKCAFCGHLVGYIYDDGPPMMSGTGQCGFGPSQVIPRAPRYRLKVKALDFAR